MTRFPSFDFDGTLLLMDEEEDTPHISPEEFLADADLLNAILESSGEQLVRTNVIRFGAATSYLMTNHHLITNPPEDTADCLIETMTDLWLNMTTFMALHTEEFAPVMSRKEAEWKKLVKELRKNRLQENEIH